MNAWIKILTRVGLCVEQLTRGHADDGTLNGMIYVIHFVKQKHGNKNIRTENTSSCSLTIINLQIRT